VINLDSLLLAFPERWHFGPDNTGNIFAPDALNSLRHQKFELITGDGGIDCSADPEFQEQNSAQLKEAEYLAICDKVARGGNAVLKLFNCCHRSSLMLLESAANSFQSAYLTKPASSKAGNSAVF
jgi:cap2 methyltransferase